MTNEFQPVTTYMASIWKLSGADGSVIWSRGPFTGLQDVFGLATIGNDAFWGGIIDGGVSGVDPFGTGIVTGAPKGFITKVTAALDVTRVPALARLL